MTQSLRDIDPAAFARYMSTKYPAPVSRQYTVEQRGHERSVLITRGAETVAEVFTDIEAGDQYRTARLFAAAPALLEALRGLVTTLEGMAVHPSHYAAARAAIAAAEYTNN